MQWNINGVLLLDKPVGFTSNAALQVVKKLFFASKAGHTGSLDPGATGMLPICFGEATKFSQFLLEANKHYLVTGKLGETTASGDRESAVTITRAVKDIQVKLIEQVLAKFRGKISQLPPMYSAIKYQGRPLYELARKGLEVERNPREINIYNLQLMEFSNNLVQFDVYCSKGTYVRTLVVDIGESLGCGAHVVALRRLAVGPYRSEQMVTLAKIRELAASNNRQALELCLLPIESILAGIPEVALTVDMIHYLFLGQALLVPSAPRSGLVKLKNKEGKFLGVGEVMLDGKVAPRKMVKI